MEIAKKILTEVETYKTQVVQVGEHDAQYSQYKLVRRIRLFQNRIYPNGKVSADGSYKGWYDIIHPAVNNEVKNLRFESRNILPFSTAPVQDFAPVFILIAAMAEYNRDNGIDEELNDTVEMFSGMGNILWKDCGDEYEICDFENTYITNQTAKTVDDTAIIQRAQYTQSQLRAKTEWKNVEHVIADCGKKERKQTGDTTEVESTSPLYTLYERNGEVSEKELYEAQGKEGGDDTKYLLARIIVAADDYVGGKKYVVFAEPFPKNKKMSDVFIEAHRGPYKGKWFREGLYELLFDYQYRINEIGQQITSGLEWASKAIFKDENPQFFNNIKTQLKNGRVIKSSTLSQVDVRMQGIDQLIADYNRIKQMADAVSNSLEVVTGESMPSGMPFRMGQLLDTNANKLYTHLRGKFGIGYAQVFRRFVITKMVKELKGKDIIRVTGSKEILDRFRTTAVDSWYLQNLARIGPHTKEMADELKKEKLAELERTEPMIQNTKKIWDGVLPRIHVTITGENYNESANMQTVGSLLQFEDDPTRRAFLLDSIYAAKGIAIPPKPAPQPQEMQQQGMQRMTQSQPQQDNQLQV